MFEEDMSPTMKEALDNPDIPHVRFDSLAIAPRVRLVSSEVEEDYVLLLLKDDKTVATLEINMEELENLLKNLSPKKFLEFLN